MDAATTTPKATAGEEKDDERVRIVIDMREDALWDAVEPEEGYSYEKAPLDIGDIAFYVREKGDKEVLILERKTVHDLAASQRDGRYREQRARLLAKKGTGVAIGYVLEVGSFPWGFTQEHLQNAFLRLQLRYGLAVLQSGSVADTAAWIKRIAHALLKDPTVFQGGLADSAGNAAAAYTEAIHVKKASNMSADRVLSTLLRTVPGCGPAAADAIVGHVGSAGFPGFFGLSEAELAAIPQSGGKRKVGAAVAKKLWTTFHGSL